MPDQQEIKYREVSESEVEYLFRFLKKKYVHYIDVQFELVDHLASSIEDLWKADPTLSFEDALSKVYSRFPVTGFTKYIEQVTKSMNRYWYKRVFTYILSFLTLPKVLLSTLLFITFFQLLMIDDIAIKWVLLSGVLFLNFASSIYIIKKVKSMVGRGEKYLFSTTFLSAAGSFFFLVFPFVNSFESMVYTDSLLVGVLFAFVLTFVTIWSYACFTAFPNMLIEDIKRKYPFVKFQTV